MSNNDQLLLKDLSMVVSHFKKDVILDSSLIADDLKNVPHVDSTIMLDSVHRSVTKTILPCNHADICPGKEGYNVQQQISAKS